MAETEKLPPGADNPPPLVEIGSSGLRRSGGIVNEEYLNELRGRQALEAYRRMGSDPVISGLLFVFEALLRKVEWTVEAVDDSPAATEAQEFLEGCMNDMEGSWSDMLGEISTMFQYGFAPMEPVYKQRRGPDETDPRYQSQFDDRKYGWRKISLRAQHSVDRWVFVNETGEILGFWQELSDIGLAQQFVPASRLLLFRTRIVSNNPQGYSLLRGAYKPWWLRSKLEQIEAIGVERDLAGLPMYHVPSSVLLAKSPEARKARDDAKALVKSIRRDEQEGLVLPSDRDEKGNLLYEFSLLSSAGSRQLDTSKIIERYDARILMSCLADFMMLGTGKTGSYALSSDKTELFSVALAAYVNSIEDIFNRFAVPALWKLNGMDRATMPRLKAGDIEPPDLAALGGFLTAFTGAGAVLFPDRVLEDDLRAKAGLPPVPEDRDDELLARQQAGVPPENDPQLAGFFGDGAEETRTQEAHDSAMKDAEVNRKATEASTKLDIKASKETTVKKADGPSLQDEIYSAILGALV